MYNNTRTHNQHASAHNPRKKGESGAINKLTENEDENADDTCGCDSPLDRSGDDTSENAAEDSSRNPNKPTGTGNEGQTAQSQNQNRPGTPKKNVKGPSVEAVTEEDDEIPAATQK